MNELEMYIESFKIKWDAFLLGCDAVEEMDLWDKEALGEMESFYANDLTAVIIRLIAADGTFTTKEVDYLNRTFGLTYTLEALEDVYNSCRNDVGQSLDENFENGITRMRRINPKLADAYKELLGLICDIIIASDDVIAQAEVAEVQRLKTLCE